MSNKTFNEASRLRFNHSITRDSIATTRKILIHQLGNDDLFNQVEKFSTIFP